MADARDIKDLRNAIGRGLSACFVVEREYPGAAASSCCAG